MNENHHLGVSINENHKWGVPQNKWFIRENPIEIDDDWRYPYFTKPPYRNSCYCCSYCLLLIYEWDVDGIFMGPYGTVNAI